MEFSRQIRLIFPSHSSPPQFAAVFQDHTLLGCRIGVLNENNPIIEPIFLGSSVIIRTTRSADSMPAYLSGIPGKQMGANPPISNSDFSLTFSKHAAVRAFWLHGSEPLAHALQLSCQLDAGNLLNSRIFSKEFSGSSYQEVFDCREVRLTTATINSLLTAADGGAPKWHRDQT